MAACPCCPREEGKGKNLKGGTFSTVTLYSKCTRALIFEISIGWGRGSAGRGRETCKDGGSCETCEKCIRSGS
jgi:hypothetical protein